MSKRTFSPFTARHRLQDSSRHRLQPPSSPSPQKRLELKRGSSASSPKALAALFRLLASRPRATTCRQTLSPSLHPKTREAMVDAWWPLLGAAIPALVAGQFVRIKRRRDEEQRLKAARGREKSSDEVFVCERVCTSKRMLKKVGAFSKDPIPETCVTVCGVSELDACADACARTVCVNQHQVPNWNDVCLKRCQSECLKLSSNLM
ncbi:uncharacterized protein LOC100276776 [Zea mays]|nr:uncharacterized protein LOC100276776 [Zea mays]|eukprot:NP_001143961.2 uncharacterized protein LOC100276776 [Zea mays]